GGERGGQALARVAGEPQQVAAVGPQPGARGHGVMLAAGPRALRYGWVSARAPRYGCRMPGTDAGSGVAFRPAGVSQVLPPYRKGGRRVTRGPARRGGRGPTSRPRRAASG